MLASLALSIAIFTPPPQNAASQLVSKMLKFYSEAETMSGTITLTASDGTGQAQCVTILQFSKPSKLYIKQVKGGQKPLQWLVTSDGNLFSYEAPGHLPGSAQRLTEKIKQIDGSYDVRRIYSVAAYGSLGDRSVPLDIAIGRSEDLKHDVMTWVTVESNGKATYRGTPVNSITGQWRPYGNAETAGTYQMLITDEGKLLNYAIFQKVGKDEVKLQEVWDVDLTMNGKVDESLFRVIR